MPAQVHLLPSPKKLHLQKGTFQLPPEMYLLLPESMTDTFPADHFISSAKSLTTTKFHLTKSPSQTPQSEIRLTLNPNLFPKLSPAIRAQSYTLTITPKGITLSAPAATGLFYALQTLLQILRETSYAAPPSKSSRQKPSPLITHHSSLCLPCIAIQDWPDYERRGFYHDTARGKVPTLATLLQLIDDLAHLKYNEFQLYIENNYQFRKHPAMYDDTTPFTAEEMLVIDAACKQRHIDFVPSLTSLGHFEKILSRPQYRPLAEAEPAQLKAIGATCWYEAAPWSLCVTDPKARQLLADMYADFLPNFSSPHFNICCDEAYDLGKVRSKKLADKIGTGQMYIDWIDYCNTMSLAHNKSIQMWGDIILNHPELIEKLPNNCTLLEWGYEHNHKFDEHCKTFAERLGTQNSELGTRSFYVSPGTSSWLTLSARTKNACGNIHNAATAGLKYGATGLLLTDWGDNGHQQMLAVSLVPMAYGAAASWNLKATENPVTNDQFSMTSLLPAASLHLFGDPAGTFAQIAYDLGLTYERLEWQRFNASLDWFLFREKWDFANYVNRAPTKALQNTIAATRKLAAQFRAAGKRLHHPDADVLADEFIFTADEIIHTCERTLLRQHWLAAAPKTRNPEEPTRRDVAPKPLPKHYKKQMAALAKEVPTLKNRLATLWLTRNKPSRLVDVTAEFDRLEREYKQFK